MSYSTDPYTYLGLPTPTQTQSSEYGSEPFDYGSNYSETELSSNALVGLSNSQFDIGHSHAFGPELRLSPIYDTEANSRSQYPEGLLAKDHIEAPPSQTASDQNFRNDQAIVEPVIPRNFIRRTNEFQWNVADASLHHQPQQFMHGTRQVSFAPLIPPIPLYDNGSQSLRAPHHYHHVPISSYSSWDLLHSGSLTTSPWGTEDLLLMPTGPGTQSGHLKSYEASLSADSALISQDAVYSPPSSKHSLIQSMNAAYPDSLRLSSNSNDLEAVSNSKASTKRKRGKLSPVRRAKAKAIRRMGSCVRCRVMKSDCDGNNPCARCVKVIGKARTYLEPCYREDLGSISLVRRGNSEFDQEIMAFRDYSWKSTIVKPKVLCLSWSLPTIASSNLPKLKVECNEFAKRYGDITDAVWQHKGRVRIVKLPCYACRDTSKLLCDVAGFLDTGRMALERDLVDQVPNELERISLREAHRYADQYQSKLLRIALRLRTNTILSAGSGTLEGGETLGIRHVDDAAAGYVGDRPLPPAIDHQIDVAIWEYIRKDQADLIRQLKKVLFQQSGHKPWFEIFLTFFIALANVQYVHGQAVGWMKSQLETDSAVRVSYLVKKMIEHWNYSADNVLHHFRSIFRGELPLATADRDLDELVQRENLDSKSKAYIVQVLRIIKDQDGSFLRPRTVSTGSNTPEVTELGDHWIRRLFTDQYLVPRRS